MATTVAQVQEVATEFAALSDSVVQSYIDIAQEYVSLSYWGAAKFDYIHALMTAHIMTMANAAGTGGSSSGAVSSERLGDIAISYAVSATAADDLTSSRYGTLIKFLSKSVLKTPMGY